MRRWADVRLWVAVCILAKISFRSPRVHSGIRVHLTLRGRNSLYIHPIGTKCTSNAFFFHAEDGKNIFLSLLHFGGGKLATPPPLATIDRFRNKGQRWFSLLWRTFAVRRQTRTPWRWRFVRRLVTRSWFSPRKERWREVRTSSVLEQFPDGVQDQDGHSTCTYSGVMMNLTFHKLLIFIRQTTSNR